MFVLTVIVFWEVRMLGEKERDGVGVRDLEEEVEEE